MAKNTYILLCEFKQADLPKLQSAGAQFKKDANALGVAVKTVDVEQIFLTTSAPQVVLIVTAPSEAEARKILGLFDDTKPIGHTILTVAKNSFRGVRKTFNGHTKMR